MSQVAVTTGRETDEQVLRKSDCLLVFISRAVYSRNTRQVDVILQDSLPCQGVWGECRQLRQGPWNFRRQIFFSPVDWLVWSGLVWFLTGDLLCRGFRDYMCNIHNWKLASTAMPRKWSLSLGFLITFNYLKIKWREGLESWMSS